MRVGALRQFGFQRCERKKLIWGGGREFFFFFFFWAER